MFFYNLDKLIQPNDDSPMIYTLISDDDYHKFANYRRQGNWAKFTSRNQPIFSIGVTTTHFQSQETVSVKSVIMKRAVKCFTISYLAPFLVFGLELPLDSIVIGSGLKFVLLFKSRCDCPSCKN